MSRACGPRQHWRRAALFVAVLSGAGLGGTRGTQDAVANGDTRTISIYHTHTRETATVTYRRNGQYDPRALEQLNWLLRDWRRDEPTRMDPRLFDVLWEVTRSVGTQEPIHVVSAYRSPATNAMLRRRSRAVAKHSQHMLGKAMDFYLPDVPVERIRAIGMRLQSGGVGFYPTAYTPFIHLDVGSVRAWPRMTREQLVRLFPDGRTVHIPADGTPLPGYEEARAEVLARGGTVAGVTAVAEAEEGTSPPARRRSFWAMLFGGGDEDEDAAQTAPAGPGRSAAPTAVASAGEARNRLARAAPATPVEEELGPTTPAPRPVDVPAPPVRLAAASAEPEPRLVWQQGAGGQEIPASGLGGAPVPPRRPEDLFAKVVAAHAAATDIAATGALGYAPMPPARPSALAGSMPWAAVEKPLGAAEPSATPLIASPPLPPARPVEVASLTPVTMAASAAAPLLVPPAPGPSGASEQPAGRQESHAQLRILFSPKSTEAVSEPGTARRKAKPGPANVREAPSAEIPAASAALVPAGGPTLALAFSTRPMEDLQVGRFSGPAVKPLPVLR